MERIAFHLEIQDGKREAYREEHEDVPEALEEAYLSSGAGIERYSCFEKDGHVFGYMELEDPEVIERVMETSRAQSEWNEVMDPILEDGDGDIWMDEVYRME
ncbi:MAG: L-rhamnose mutarotase [Halobacterium sp.]